MGDDGVYVIVWNSDVYEAGGGERGGVSPASGADFNDAKSVESLRMDLAAMRVILEM